MTPNDNSCLLLGRELVRMIRDLQAATGTDVGFSRRKFTFPGGAVDLFIVSGKPLADLFEQTAKGKYIAKAATPPSEVN